MKLAIAVLLSVTNANIQPYSVASWGVCDDSDSCATKTDACCMATKVNAISKKLCGPVATKTVPAE